MKPSFHLSIAVRSIEESTEFFVRALGASVLHRDPTGYVNVDVHGTELTLKESSDAVPVKEDFHFGINVDWNDFDELAKVIERECPANVLMTARVVDPGTPLERKKLYLRCPTGYVIELKGIKASPAEPRIVDITDERGQIVEAGWLAKAERVHRQLRPQLHADYQQTMKRVFADGARMSVALSGDAVGGVAVHRVYENTFDGVHMYVDDLVTDAALRSRGFGRALLFHMQDLARQAGCQRFTLDSGVQRDQAHRFYFREGMTVTGFHFGMSLAAVRDA